MDGSKEGWKKKGKHFVIILYDTSYCKAPLTPATMPITSSRLTRLLLLSGSGGDGDGGDSAG